MTTPNRRPQCSRKFCRTNRPAIICSSGVTQRNSLRSVPVRGSSKIRHGFGGQATCSGQKFGPTPGWQTNLTTSLSTVPRTGTTIEHWRAGSTNLVIFILKCHHRNDQPPSSQESGAASLKPRQPYWLCRGLRHAPRKALFFNRATSCLASISTAFLNKDILLLCRQMAIPL